MIFAGLRSTLKDPDGVVDIVLHGGSRRALLHILNELVDVVDYFLSGVGEYFYDSDTGKLMKSVLLHVYSDGAGPIVVVRDPYYLNSHFAPSIFFLISAVSFFIQVVMRSMLGSTTCSTLG